MKKREKLAAVCLFTATIVLTASVSIHQLHVMSERKVSPHSGRKTSEATEEWFTESDFSESFDFGLDENWIDLNGLEYLLTDNLKCYLMIGTDHSGNESATDNTYKGSMADFLLVAIRNKTDRTYGFIQLNRDTITDVMILDTAVPENCR